MAVVIAMKAIKPKKLKVDAIRLEILNELRKEGTVHRKELKKTVSTWKNKPKFESLFGLGSGDATVVTGPAGNDRAVQHWVWTDQGTRAHMIVARRAKRLAFQTGSTPKTSRGKFKSGRGRRSGPYVFPRAVRHPGTKAREWTIILTKRRKRPYTRRMIKAMQRAAKKAF